MPEHAKHSLINSPLDHSASFKFDLISPGIYLVMPIQVPSILFHLPYGSGQAGVYHRARSGVHSQRHTSIHIDTTL